MSAKRIFFTSDTHFGDSIIIRKGWRPYATVEEMDAALIANWNATVGPEDTVYHLGDFAHRACFNARDYLDQLNGRIHLIEGNHDDVVVETAGELFESVDVIKELDWKGHRFVLFHYPMRDWANAVRGSFHLFGHVHGRLDKEPVGRSLDVCVDSHDLAPVSIETVTAILSARSQHQRGMSLAG